MEKMVYSVKSTKGFYNYVYFGGYENDIKEDQITYLENKNVNDPFWKFYVRSFSFDN